MRSVGRRGVLGAVAVGAVAIVAACGGGDGNGDSEASVEEYRAQADAICARYDAQFDALEEPTSADDVRQFIVDTLEIGQQQTAELAALEVPSELADLEAQARANNDEAVELLEGAIERIDDGEDVGAIVDEVTAESQRIEDSNDEIAREMGLEVCGADDEDDVTTTTNPPDDTLGDPDTTTTTDAEPTDTTGSAAGQYLLDVSAASTSLNEIGEIFTNADDPEALQAQAGAVQASVDEFNGAIESMTGYTLDDPQLEQQRQGFVAAGQELAAPLGDLADAVAAGDVAAIGETLPALQAAATEFQEVTQQVP